MTKTCSELFQGMDCAIIGNGNEEVAGLAFRSDEVRPNDMFFCIVGTVVDGHSFAQDAIDRGATSLVAERKVYLADATDVTEIVVKDTGVGIADVEQARTPLYTTGGADRSGMGFTIMESFMDQMKVRSAPGKGTTVTMRRRISRRLGA